jgi:hypothetical protein
MSKQHFNDDQDFINDDGYPEIPDAWLEEEAAYWSEDTLDPSDSGNYDSVEGSDNDESDNSEPSDDWDDEGWDDTPIGLDYDGYNDADNY